MRLRAVLRQHIFILDAELKVIWRRAPRALGRGVDESISDDVDDGVDDAEAADAGAVSAGFLGESDAFAVESYWGAGDDEGDLEGELLGAALIGIV
jgi:hypothetical protein